MTKDYGFELPDMRYQWTTENEAICSVHIVRDYYSTEDDFEDENDLNFHVRWEIRLNNKQVMLLPEKTSEDAASQIARILYTEKDYEEELREEVLVNLKKEMSSITYDIEFAREGENFWLFTGKMFEVDTYHPEGGKSIGVSLKVNKNDGKIFMKNSEKPYLDCMCSVFV